MIRSLSVRLALSLVGLFSTVVVVTADTFINITDLPQRVGERPRTSSAPEGTLIAHEQLTDLAPPELQERLFQRASSLPHVTTGPSHVSVPGARAFHLSADVVRANAEAFMVRREFAHLHPERDGSLHMSLPPEVAREVLEKGWGETHPRNPRVLMVYGPRTDYELEVVWEILLESYLHAVEEPIAPAAEADSPDTAP